MSASDSSEVMFSDCTIRIRFLLKNLGARDNWEQVVRQVPMYVLLPDD